MKRAVLRGWLCGMAAMALLLFGSACTTAAPASGLQNYPLDGPNLELLKLGDELFRRGKRLDAQHMYARAVNANGPNHAHVEACAQMGLLTLQEGKAQEAKIWLNLGRRRAHEQDPLGWSRLQLVIGILERDRGGTDEALARFKELYAYCMQHSLYGRAIGAAQEVVHTSSLDEERVAWSQKGIEAAEEGEMFEWLGTLWSRKGKALREESRVSEARVAFQAAKDYFAEAHDRAHEFAANWDLSRALRESGELAEARGLSAANLMNAIEYYDQDPNPANAKRLGYCLWEVAELSALDGHGAEALEGFRAARARLLEAGLEHQGAFGDSELARLDARLGEQMHGAVIE